jgi:antitoxin VapB
MTLQIMDREADTLARELADTTGETISQAVIQALRERLERERARQWQAQVLTEKLLSIGAECAILPALDSRSADEIIDYDLSGLPR